VVTPTATTTSATTNSPITPTSASKNSSIEHAFYSPSIRMHNTDRRNATKGNKKKQRRTTMDFRSMNDHNDSHDDDGSETSNPPNNSPSVKRIRSGSFIMAYGGQSNDDCDRHRTDCGDLCAIEAFRNEQISFRSE
jgi:hypothetical protein